MAKEKINVAVSQLTAHERKQLNMQRTCVICGDTIHDYDKVTFQTRRDRRNVEYVFAHGDCGIEYGEPDLFYFKGIIDGE